MTQTSAVDSYRPSIVFSTCTWLSLVAGLGVIAVLATFSGAAELQAVRSRLSAEQAAVEEIEVAAERLVRIVTALETNPLFRTEWVRREWNAPLAGGNVEAIATGDQFEELLAFRQSFQAETGKKTPPMNIPIENPLGMIAASQASLWIASILIALGIIGPSLDAQWQRFLLRRTS